MWTPTDQFIGLTGLTGTWEKSCNAVNTSRSIAAPWCLLVTITCIFFAPPPVPRLLQLPAECKVEWLTDAGSTKQIYLSTLWRPGEGGGEEEGKMQDHLFFFFNPSFSAVYTPDRGWSLSSLCSLDSCRHKWPRSPSSLMPVDSRVAAGQPIMKWPWSGVSRAMELLKH